MESEFAISKCPSVEAVTSGKVNYQGEDVPVEVVMNNGDFIDEESHECALQWILRHHKSVEGVQIQCRSCQLSIKYGNLGSLD
jgi:hypothetical protein